MLEFLDSIYNSIELVKDIDIPSGVCGIGWGIEYLAQNELIEGCTDDILIDVDKLVEQRCRQFFLLTNYSSSEIQDLSDILRYISIRLTSVCGDFSQNPFSNLFLKDCVTFYNGLSDNLIVDSLQIFENVLKKGRYVSKRIDLISDMYGQIPIDFTKLVFMPMELRNGLSGAGVKILKGEDDV